MSHLKCGTGCQPKYKHCPAAPPSLPSGLHGPESVEATEPFVTSLICRLGAAAASAPGSQVSMQQSSLSRGGALCRRTSFAGDGKMDLDVMIWALPFKSLELQREIGHGSFGRCATTLQRRGARAL